MHDNLISWKMSVDNMDIREDEMDRYTLKHYNVSWRTLKKFLCSQEPANYSFCNLQLVQDNEQSNTTSMDPYLMSLFISIIAVFIVGLFCNVSMILTIRRSKRFSKPYWSYAENMAFMDILTLLSMLFFLFYLHFEPTNWPVGVHKFLFSSVDMFLASGSMLFVAVLAIERVFSLMMWNRGQKIIRKTRIIVCAIWVYSLTLLALGLVRIFIKRNQAYNDFLFWWSTACVFFVSFTITFVSYAYVVIYHVIEHLKNSNTFSWLRSNPLLRTSQCNKGLTKSRSSAVLFVLAPLPFFCGWSFFLGVQTYEVVYGQVYSDISLNMAMLLTPWIVAALNPMAFVLASSKLRKTFCKDMTSFFQSGWRRIFSKDEQKHLAEEFV